MKSSSDTKDSDSNSKRKTPTGEKRDSNEGKEILKINGIKGVVVGFEI
jgi:hypothetical protein